MSIEELARGWEPEAETWEPDAFDDPIGWLPCDAWLDSQAERYEAIGSDIADFAARLLRREAKAFRALDAHTIEQYETRAATYND